MVRRDLGIPEIRTGAGEVRRFKLQVGSSCGARMKFSRQTTLRSQATVTGVGVHSGLPVSLTIGPAPLDAGFIFVRTGLEGSDRDIRATAQSLVATAFAPVLGGGRG